MAKKHNVFQKGVDFFGALTQLIQAFWKVVSSVGSLQSHQTTLAKAVMLPVVKEPQFVLREVENGSLLAPLPMALIIIGW